MTEDDNNQYDDTKDLTENLSDRRILIEIRHAITTLLERVTALEHRTNPLPPNFDGRFTALEMRLAEFQAETKRNFKLLQNDIYQVRQDQAALEERVETLERRPN